MNVLGIDFTFFAVSDMQKSLTFYRDLLGIPLACLVYEGTWAEFEINPGTLVLGQGHGFTQPGGGMVALAVEGREGCRRRIGTRGNSCPLASR